MLAVTLLYAPNRRFLGDRPPRLRPGGQSPRAWEDFVTELVNDREQQQARAEAIKAHPELPFKAAEHA